MCIKQKMDRVTAKYGMRGTTCWKARAEEGEREIPVYDNCRIKCSSLSDQSEKVECLRQQRLGKLEGAFSM
jgi:hypothetical protein